MASLLTNTLKKQSGDIIALMSKKTKQANKLAKTWQWIKTHWWQVGLVGLVVIALPAFMFYKKTQGQKKDQKFVSPTYQDITKNLEITGVVDADEKVRLRFLTGGKVVYLGAQEGDQVKKYQTIATIDQATLKKQLEMDLNNYLIQRENWEQVRDDYVENGDGIPQPIADIKDQRYVKKQQLLLDNSVIKVEIDNIAVTNNHLNAPFSGILTHSPIKTAGGQLTANDYFEIINPDTLVFKAAVDEADIAQVKKGQEAEIVLDAYPTEKLSSQVSFISYTSQRSSDGSTVYIVKLPLTENDLNKFRLGMNGDAYIKLAEKNNVLTLPIDALSEEDGKWYVQVKNDQGKLEKKEVYVGLMTDDEAEITGGLDENDQVLLPE